MPGLTTMPLKAEGDSSTGADAVLNPAPETSVPSHPEAHASPKVTTNEAISTADKTQQAAVNLPPIDSPNIVLKDRFVLEEMLARGGMGMVYKALDLRKTEYQDRNPYVAIKILNDECQSHPDFFMALQREAKKAQSLAHPNIATVYDFDADGDTVFMTMEYLEGQTLDVFIKGNAPSPSHHKNLLQIVDDMGQGLAYAHKNHIVHSDLKPGNVFITDKGTVKILDFGISRVARPAEHNDLDATIFDAGKFGALTPSYASCEMLEGNTPDLRDDIYALACITYELLTGRHPFNREKATLARHKQMRAEPIKGLSKKCWKGILRGLAFNRQSRTPSVEQFLQDIQPHSSSPSLLRGWPLGFGLGVLFLLAGLVYINALNEPTSPSLSAITPPITKPNTATESRNTRPSLTRQEQEKIARLLEVADIHFIVGRIIDPPGSNAYEAYRQVLEINPSNPQAQSGLIAIADHYQQLAATSLAKDDLAGGRALIVRGLEILPTHPGLMSLYRQAHEN